MTNAHHETDIAIIGAGPVGLFAVFECGMLRMRCHVIDALDGIGGQCTALYPEKPIYDVPGFPAIDAADLIERLEQQAAPFNPVFHLGQRVERLTPRGDGGGDGDGWVLETTAGTTIAVKAVMIAGGVGAFGPNRPPLAGLEAYEGRSVHYMVQRKAEFAGRRVVIAGGGDSALDWAIALADLAAHVYLVHRRPKFRAAPDSVAKAEALAAAGRVEMVIPYQLAALDGADGQISTVTVATLDGQRRDLPADALLAFFGLSSNLGPMLDWGLSLEKSQITVDPSTCETNLPGIYAIGDIASYPKKLKLILTGFSDAAMAAHAAFPRVHPDAVLRFEHSTTKGIPKSQ